MVYTCPERANQITTAIQRPPEPERNPTYLCRLSLGAPLMEALSVQVIVPDGVYEGQEFFVDYEGESLCVVCPDGCGPGSDISIDVPPPPPPPRPLTEALSVQVIVPDGVYEGQEFFVDYEGESLCVVCPDGCGPGSDISIDVPPPPPPPAPLREKDAHGSEKENAPSNDVRGTQGVPHGGSGGGGGSSSGDGEPCKARAFKFALKLSNGVALNLNLAHACKYAIGSMVEVMRTDGDWSLAKVKDYDWRGGTYTVQVRTRRHACACPPLPLSVLLPSAASAAFRRCPPLPSAALRCPPLPSAALRCPPPPSLGAHAPAPHDIPARVAG